MAELSTSDRFVFLIAGEPSGDVLGAKLMRALKAATGGRVRFAGVGGERMAAEGLVSLFPLQDIAVMGLAEVLPQLPVIFRRLRDTARAIEAQRPDAVVTIDSPGFCFRVAERVRHLGLPVIHYVAPQLWAWRPKRVKKLARRIDHMLLLLPFEPAFFERAGVPCTYVGHPVLEDADVPAAPDFRQRHAIAENAPVVLFLPGSRRGLARRMLPAFGRVVAILRTRHPDLRVVVPVVAGTRETVVELTRDWSVPPVLIQDVAEKRAAFMTATAAVTVSGTSAMELAVAGLPMVVTYLLNPLSAWLARRMVKVSHVALPNLVVGRTIAPELLQEDCTPERIAEEAERLLTDPAARAAQKAGFVEACAKLGQDGQPPSARAAAAILREIERHTAARPLS